jgi:hypothetical protein
MNETDLEQKVRPPQPSRPFVRELLLVLALVVLALGILLARGWRPTSTSGGADAPSGVPTSASIEANYGIRFTSVAVTAGGGMIQIRYQVLDSDKTLAVHDKDVAPFVVDGSGVKYADPGMVGHSHVGTAKAPGTSDYILLANARGGVRPGSVVTIKVGDLELRNVPVL